MAFSIVDLISVGLKDVGTTPVVMFTAPSTADRRYVFTAFTVSNNLSASVAYTVTLNDASKSNEVRNIGKTIVLPAGSFDYSEDRLIIEPDDVISITCDTLLGVDVNASIAVTTI